MIGVMQISDSRIAVVISSRRKARKGRCRSGRVGVSNRAQKCAGQGRLALSYKPRLFLSFFPATYRTTDRAGIPPWQQRLRCSLRQRQDRYRVASGFRRTTLEYLRSIRLDPSVHNATKVIHSFKRAALRPGEIRVKLINAPLGHYPRGAG
jgi:hypothetical protein